MDSDKLKKRQADDLRRIKQLRLMDDDFMTKCFEDSPECVELILHIILDKPDLRVIEVRTQHPVKNLQGRSVRLDILAIDSEGKLYNIEIQRDDRGAGAKRARFNSSLMDANNLPAGDDTENLPETYVIFITENDVLGKNKALYHIDRVIRETGDNFDDGAHIIYVNGAIQDETPLGKLMHDFSCTDPSSMNYQVLAERTSHFKDDKEGTMAMSKIFDEIREESLEEGLEKGRKEGAAEKLLYTLKELAKNLNITIEQAMDAASVPDEDRDFYRSRLTQ